ncbi:MAG: histidine--tRNA ligase [Elusimicrobiota bacterium]|jgi:histidyl-tRNA synthetase|nr:histidine--tRNA ligase [Elusimicrobiota bacterium]
MKYKAVRGTRDIFGDLIEKFKFVEKIAKKIFDMNGFLEIRTPIFENKEVFIRTLGNEADIVSKEMYDFFDKGNRSLALRPEGTASIVRAVIENNLIQNGIDKKFYYIGPMFRYDRPQAGRYRQFYQIGVEIFGNKNSFLDAEVISLAVKIIEQINIHDFVLEINSLGCDECRENYIKVLQNYIKNQNSEFCENCKNKIKIQKNILRIFDCKIENCKKILQNAPKITDNLCENCKNYINEVIENLTKINIINSNNFKINKNLVRGLDYYTGIVFEITTNALGAQNAICAGGRYDNLVSEFSKNSVPAIGFAIGEDRVVEILLQNEKKESSLATKRTNASSFNKIFFITTNKEKHREQIFENYSIIQKLRDNDYIVLYNSEPKSIKSQIRTADYLKVGFVVFIEDDETFNLKNMATGEQKKIEKEKIFDFFKI